MWLRPSRFAVLLSVFACCFTGFGAVLGQAEWIAPPSDRSSNAPCPIFRKEFLLRHRPRSATLRIVGLGDYDVRINGKRLAPTGINQPWSQYEKTIYYQDFAIGPLLRSGANCIGVMLQNSFWNNPVPPPGKYYKAGPQRTAAEAYLLCAEISGEQKDGSVFRVDTDTSWSCAEGPITFSHVYGGEDYDARRELPRWDRPGFDDRAWKPARRTDAPVGALEKQFWPGFSTFEHQNPVAIMEPETNVFLYSFPQNMAAQLRVEVKGGKAGDVVHFRCGEHKNPKDRLFGGYVVGCDLVSDGKRVTHQWLSFYLGMQFVEVNGAVPIGRPNPDNLPVIEGIELVNVRAALPDTGAFRCSSELYNATHRIIDAAMRANMSWVMTDCPHREKLGWLECSYLLAPSFEYRYECRDWLAKIARDVCDAQESNGRVLTVAPSYPAGKFPGAFNWTVEWGATAALLPWLHYEWYGDKEILRKNFDMMRRFTDYVTSQAKDGVAPGGLGDWYDYGHGQPPGPSRYTATTLSATATWAMCALSVAKSAEVLGLSEDAERYRQLHHQIASDFCRHFQDPTTRKLHHKGSPQCASAMALCAEVVPAADRAVLVQDIVSDLEQRGWQQTPGDVGHVYFIRALAQAGRSDVLHRVYSREGIGSYAGILKKGLTSLPETWDAMMDGYQSLNHCMLGHVIEWYYGYVAGIRQAPGSVGWHNALIAPNPGPLNAAEATLQTPRGRVMCRWKKDNKIFQLEAEIPSGVEATAILPSGTQKRLTSGKQVLKEPIAAGDGKNRRARSQWFDALANPVTAN